MGALFAREAHHAPAKLFLTQLAEARSVIVFNQVLELELRETAFKLPLSERFPRDWKRRRHDGRSLRRARRLVGEAIEAWEELLTAFSYIVIEVGEILDRIDELMGRFGLSSNDAAMAATAEFTDARTIVTTDAGFASIPEPRLTVYTNSGRVAVCRRMRGGLAPN